MKTINQINSRFHQALLISSITCLMFGSAAVQADDIEIYLTTPPAPVAPNVLFVLDESGSMSTDGRLGDLKSSLRGILTDDANENINAAILAYTLDRYDNDYWDSVRAISGFSLLGGNDGGNGDAMADDVDDLQAESGTPSVKALSDAVNWFKSGFTDTLHNIGDTSNTYPSPLAGDEESNWCKPNHIVFMTDGRPNSNNPTSSLVTATWALSQYPIADNDSDPTNDAVAACDPLSPSWAATTIKTNTDDYEYLGGLCAGEIAKWAYETDLKDWPGQQNIITHTIGLDIDDFENDGVTIGAEKEFLVNIAETMGGGKYYPASDAASLTAAFNKILEDAGTAIQYTYSSPTIPYNPDNSAVSDDFIYVPNFSPLASRYWKGNLKKYRVALDDDGDIVILDRNDANVVDDSFGFVTETQDYWTSEADSGAAYYGGAVSNMSDSTTRNLYTWLEGSDTDLTATVTAVNPNGDAVTISPNRVHNDNIIITAGMVGADTGSDDDKAIDRSEYLNWANWSGDAYPDPTPSDTACTSLPPLSTFSVNNSFPEYNCGAGTRPDDLREYMGAPIHTKPAVTRYNTFSFTDNYPVVNGDDNSINLGNFTPPWSDGDLVVYSSNGNVGLALEDGGFLSDGAEYKVITGGTSIQLALSGDAPPLTPIDLADSGDTGLKHSFITPDDVDVVLMTTSEGVLHAFDGGSDKVNTDGTVDAIGDGGDELWSFMPRRFLTNIKELRDNASADTPDYGLDGPLTIYESGGKKYVAMTMRRGGRDIYVLDITDINAPKMAWEIIGGATTGFAELGQTWSEVQFLRMELNGAEARDVLIFGGGYDNTTQDPATDGTIPTSRAPDTMGNAIYVVDPATGARLAYFTDDLTTDPVPAVNSLQVAGMENGIIGILPVDINNNGITDRMYASGVGGRIFRIDIPDNGFPSTTIQSVMVADINGSPGNPVSNTDFQRFFNKPEVAYYSRGGVTFLGILIGSGYRPSPLDNSVKDRFYMIKDYDAFTVPDIVSESYTTITEGGLYDATANLIQEQENILAPLESALYTCLEEAVDDGLVESVNDGLLPGNSDVCEGEKEDFYDQKSVVDGHKADLAAKSGWFIDLLDLDGVTKQKVFSEARIFESVILFSTYQGQPDENTDVCSATSATGSSHIYALNLLNGSAVLDLSNANIDLGGGDSGTGGANEGVGVINSADRSITINTPGLPPSPVIVFPDPGTGEVSLSGRKAVALVGLEAVFRFPDRFFPVNWEEVIDTGITPAQ